MSAPLPRLRVIIADDQAIVRDALSVVLSLSCNVDPVATASNGQEALDLVETHRPDAVLLDLHMPILDGVATARILSDLHPEVTTVILTAYATPGEVRAARQAGAGAVITKGAEPGEIAAALGRRRDRGPSPTPDRPPASGTPRHPDPAPAGRARSRSDGGARPGGRAGRRYHVDPL